MFSKLHSRFEKWKNVATKVINFLNWRRKPGSKVTSIEHYRRIPGKVNKYAILLSYCGRDYYGMQVQNFKATIGLPTIEQQLLRAFLRLRLITDDDRKNLSLIDLDRASRTDRGVSAVRQILSVRLPLGGVKPEFVREGLITYTPQTVVAPLNALLPEEIRIMGIKRVTPAFYPKMYCNSRHYTYTLPTYALSTVDQTNFRTYRISEERLAAVNDILSRYKGEHNFYNFTRRRLASDCSCVRLVYICDFTEPFIRNGVEFLTIHIVGNSFMLHQIRKMVGVLVAMMRGEVDPDFLDRCWEPKRVHIALAPGLGLVLNDLNFHSYNNRYQLTHEPLIWDEYDEAVKAFRERYIDSVITNAEVNGETPIPEWLEYLKQYYSVELQTFIAQRDEEIESEPEASSVVDDEDRREKVSAR